MKRVGVREFKDGATTLLASDVALVVERHGKPIGFYIPLKAKDPERARASMDRFGKRLTDLLERAGMTEDELIEGLLPDRAPGR